MERKFILSCESTVDLPFSYMQSREIPVLFYKYTIGEVEYVDNMERSDAALAEFYRLVNAGGLPKTSQLNEFDYYDHLKPLLEKGDVLHIVFGSALTQSVRNAFLAAERLREEFPSRKLIVIDSLCGSAGMGILVDDAADIRDRGMTIEAVEKYVLEARYNIHHEFFVSDMSHLRRGGRVSGAAAMLGAMLNICPIIHADEVGKLIAYDKVIGRSRALKHLLKTMTEHIDTGGDGGKCVILHSNCAADGERMQAMFREAFPDYSGTLLLGNIGTILASHCGPNVVAVFFRGDRRPPHFA